MKVNSGSEMSSRTAQSDICCLATARVKTNQGLNTSNSHVETREEIKHVQI